jgi:CRP-like cAMP-binding protein
VLRYPGSDRKNSAVRNQGHAPLHIVQRCCVSLQSVADGKRQVLNLGLPGDFVGFPSCLFEVAINSVAALTDVELSQVSFDSLFVLFRRFPRLGTAIFWASAREAAMYGQHIVNLGRKSAYERLAHLLLELLVRLRSVGLGDHLSYTLPLTHELMADVLGLS